MPESQLASCGQNRCCETACYAQRNQHRLHKMQQSCHHVATDEIAKGVGQDDARNQQHDASDHDGIQIPPQACAADGDAGQSRQKGGQGVGEHGHDLRPVQQKDQTADNGTHQAGRARVAQGTAEKYRKGGADQGADQTLHWPGVAFPGARSVKFLPHRRIVVLLPTDASGQAVERIQPGHVKDYLAIATLGLGEIIRVVLQNIEYLGGSAGISPVPKYTTWPWLFACTVITVAAIINLIDSSYGRAIVSVREDEVASELMGINITRYKVLAFVVGALFAGLAGALYAHFFYIIKPETFGFLKSFDIVVMVVLGGMGSTSGAIIAAAFITVLTAVLQSFPAIRMILYALILIMVMIHRPQGLMGTREISFKGLLKRGEAK